MNRKPFLLSFLILNACAFNFEVTSQRTALENQVMGTYKELDDELVLSGAVRGGAPVGEQSAAVKARQNQMFNTDEIAELKIAGLLGEGSDGYLKRIDRRSAGVNVPKFLMETLDQLNKQENSDRETIWRHMIAQNKNLTIKDLGNIGRSYARIQREKAAVGHWYQDESGKWVQRN
jgi:uncharacterized protein YdbL (DUF1318 family)